MSQNKVARRISRLAEDYRRGCFSRCGIHDLARLSLFGAKRSATSWRSVSIPARSALHGHLPVAVEAGRRLSRQAQFELFEQEIEILLGLGVAR